MPADGKDSVSIACHNRVWKCQDRNNATMIISPLEIPKPSEKGTAHAVVPRPSHMLFHAVVLADRGVLAAGIADGVTHTQPVQGIEADTAQGAAPVAPDAEDAGDTATRARQSRTAAPEGPGVEGSGPLQRADPEVPDPEPALGTTVRARPSGPVSPEGSVREDALPAPHDAFDVHADGRTPEPQISGDGAGLLARGREARSEYPIMMRFQIRTSGQGPGPAQDALVAPLRDAVPTARPAWPLMPGTEIRAQAGPVANSEFPAADSVVVSDVETAAHPDTDAALRDAAIGRPIRAARDATGSTESRRIMPEQAIARRVPDRPHDALTLRAPGTGQARGAQTRGAMEALLMARAAEPGLTDATTPLTARHPTSEPPAAADPVAATRDGPGLADMRRAETGMLRAPAAPLPLIGEADARIYTVTSVALPSAASRAIQGKAMADALPGPYGDAGLQGARTVSGPATDTVTGMVMAAGLATRRAISPDQTGASGVAVLRDTLAPGLSAPETVETAIILPQRPRAESGQAIARQQEPPPGSSPPTVLLSAGAFLSPGNSATVTVPPDPRLILPAPDKTEIVHLGRPDRPDGGSLPAPGIVQTLASQPQSQSQPQPLTAALAGESGARSLRVQILEGVRRSGQSAFEIQLAPAELGRLRISLRPGENGMQLFFTADRLETLEMIRRHAGDLEQDLRALGYDALDLGFAQSDDRRSGAGQAQTAAAGVASDMPALSHEIAPQARSGAAGGGVDMRL